MGNYECALIYRSDGVPYLVFDPGGDAWASILCVVPPQYKNSGTMKWVNHFKKFNKRGCDYGTL